MILLLKAIDDSSVVYGIRCFVSSSVCMLSLNIVHVVFVLFSDDVNVYFHTVSSVYIHDCVVLSYCTR